MCKKTDMTQGKDGVKEPKDFTASKRATCCVISHKQFYLIDGVYYSDGGFNKYIQVLKRIFRQILLVVPVDHKNKPAGLLELDDRHVKLIELPTYNYRYPHYVLFKPWKIIKLMRESIKKACIIHVIMPGYIQVIGFILAKLYRRPLFCSLVGDWEGQFQTSKFTATRPFLIKSIIFLHNLLIRWITRSRLVFVHGEPLAERYRKYGGKNIVTNQSSTFSQQDIISEEQLIGIHDPARLLSVGRLVPKKGLDVLFKAVRKLIDQGQNVTLNIVGEGRHREPLQRLIKELDLQRHIKLLGFVKVGTGLWDIYRNHDIFVMPSISEGAPKVIIEAYANGLPVIATNVGGIPGMVSEKNGILVPVGDVNALSEAISKLISDRECRLSLAKNNIKTALSRTMESQADHMHFHLKEQFDQIL